MDWSSWGLHPGGQTDRKGTGCTPLVAGSEASVHRNMLFSNQLHCKVERTPRGTRLAV